MPAVKRSYDAPSRDAAARATRQRVLQAATDLFVTQGWAATTVAAIAEHAQVSRPTVFAVGSKAALLSAARDLAMAGDDEQVAVAQRASFQGVLACPDPAQTLDLLAAHVTRLLARYARLDGVLHQASGADEASRELWATSEQQRHAAAGVVVANLVDKGAVVAEEATDEVWALMASEPFRRLVHDRGWTEQAYTAWLARQLATVLRG